MCFWHCAVNAPVATERASAAPIAVVVPVLNEAEHIAALLDDLHGHGFAQTIVTDGGSSDGTADMAEMRPGVEVVRTGRGRGLQLNAGAGRAQADVLLFLHADTRLPAGACEMVRAALTNPAVAGGCFRLSFDAKHPLLSLYASMSAFDSVFTTFGDQAYFVRAGAFREAGTFPVWPLLEDVEFRRRLKRCGRFIKLDAAVTTSARRFQAGGILRQQVKNTFVLCAFLAGVAPERLARWYAPHRAPLQRRHP
jgi:rSAM/selenodomain-associated transferase 2